MGIQLRGGCAVDEFVPVHGKAETLDEYFGRIERDFPNAFVRCEDPDGNSHTVTGIATIVDVDEVSKLYPLLFTSEDDSYFYTINKEHTIKYLYLLTKYGREQSRLLSERAMVYGGVNEPAPDIYSVLCNPDVVVDWTSSEFVAYHRDAYNNGILDTSRISCAISMEEAYDYYDREVVIFPGQETMLPEELEKMLRLLDSANSSLDDSRGNIAEGDHC